jgi:hypothetical protein
MKLGRFQEEVDGEVRWNLGRLYVRPSQTKDAYKVGLNLRQADRDEVAAQTVESPIRVLVDGITESRPCYTIETRGGSACGIFGTRDSGYPDCGVVWMLGTDDITTNSRTFLRYSRGWINELHKKYRLLYNVIDARNKIHIEWLSWMGFEFIKTIPQYGIERRKFLLFNRYV